MMASGGEITTDEHKIILSGYLTKQGGQYRNWKKRYFVLKGTVLAYYEREGDKQAKGLIDLTKGYGVREKVETMGLGGVDWPEHVHKCVAFGVAIEGRTYYLYGESLSEVNEWKESIQQVINDHGQPNTHPSRDPQGQPEPKLLKIMRNATKLGAKVTSKGSRQGEVVYIQTIEHTSQSDKEEETEDEKENSSDRTQQ